MKRAAEVELSDGLRHPRPLAPIAECPSRCWAQALDLWHDGYHIQPRERILELLAIFDSQETADSLEYTALPFEEQFDRGVRQLELDEPGVKVLHVQDLDFETHCLTLEICLQQVKGRSDANPRHIPITIMIEAKAEVITDPLDLGFVIPLEFGPEEVADIDREILGAGYMVRTRADADTQQARDDDYTLQQAAFASGGQFVSTDYVGRCNPISAPARCESDLIRP